MTYEEENLKIKERQNEIDQEITFLKSLYNCFPQSSRPDILEDLKQERKKEAIERQLSILNHEYEALTKRLNASPSERACMDGKERISDVIDWIFEHPLLSFMIVDVIGVLIIYICMR